VRRLAEQATAAAHAGELGGLTAAEQGQLRGLLGRLLAGQAAGSG
jgi:hypothetical protein